MAEPMNPRRRGWLALAAAGGLLATGMRWAEGPAYFPASRYVLVSDIPNNRIMRYDEVTGHWGEFRAPSNYANGNARDRDGRLVTCEHLTRRVTRTEHDGRITVLAERYDGKRLNSPNDIVCAADGRKLYVVESRATPSRVMWRYDVGADGHTLSNKTRLFDGAGAGALDGFKVDKDGNLWCGWGSDGRPGADSAALDGVKVFNPDGKAIGFIHLPERCPTLVFGGPKRNRLYMASSHSLYALYVDAEGAVWTRGADTTAALLNPPNPWSILRKARRPVSLVNTRSATIFT